MFRLGPEQDSSEPQDEGLRKSVLGYQLHGHPHMLEERKGQEEKNLVVAQLMANHLNFPATACL